MRLPRILLSKSRQDARANLKPFVKEIKKGSTLQNVLVDCEMTDHREHRAPIVVENAFFTDGRILAFHLDLVWDLLERAFPKMHGITSDPGPMRKYYEELFTSDYLSLLLLNIKMSRFLYEKQFAERYLCKVAEIWETVESDGVELIFGGLNPSSIWQGSHMLRYVLAHSGVPHGLFEQKRCPEANLSKLLERYRVIENINAALAAGQKTMWAE